MSIPGLNEAKKMKELLPGSGVLPKFGYSSTPSQEKNCEAILVLMQCVGQLSERRTRASFSPHTSLRQAKEEFDKDVYMEQKVFMDENNFRFREIDLDKPLWQFSNKCSLVLSFQYDTHTEGISNKAKPLKEKLEATRDLLMWRSSAPKL